MFDSSDLQYHCFTFIDICLVIVGSLASIITGASQPLLSVIFGGMTNSFLAAEISMKNYNGLSVINFNNSSTMLSRNNFDNFSMQSFHDSTVKYALQYTYLGIAVMICSYIQVGVLNKFIFMWQNCNF